MTLVEKILAAHRVGLKHIYIPRDNEIDFEELPAEIKKDLDLILVDSVDEVIKQSLMGS